jgi:hypothetical protein
VDRGAIGAAEQLAQDRLRGGDALNKKTAAAFFLVLPNARALGYDHAVCAINKWLCRTRNG